MFGRFIIFVMGSNFIKMYFSQPPFFKYVVSHILIFIMNIKFACYLLRITQTSFKPDGNTSVFKRWQLNIKLFCLFINQVRIPLIIMFNQKEIALSYIVIYHIIFILLDIKCWQPLNCCKYYERKLCRKTKCSFSIQNGFLRKGSCRM